MSIKDLFGKKSNQILTIEKFEEVVKRDGESFEHLQERNEDILRFIPKTIINFNDPKTFARYGSAEKYYLDSIEKIINSYPYDGSLFEKTSWQNNNTYIDNYIFENEYPRTTGYISLNKNYIQSSILDGFRYLNNPQFVLVRGGPNPTPNNPTGELKRQFPEFLGKSNLLNAQQKRETNLYTSGVEGNTVEFWFKLDEDRELIDGKSILFDLWNNHEYGTDDYARFLIQLPEDKTSSLPLIEVTYTTSYESDVGGTYGINLLPIGDRDKLPSTFNIRNWNHYAISVKNKGNNLSIKLYLNGKLIQEKIEGTSVTSFIRNTNHVSATIGALQHKISTNQNNLYGFGAIKGSFDEFRFWKSARTSENIGRFWISQVHGGTNTDDSNIELGVYFKFNEGIVDTQKINSLDKQVLDYSGRISNGTIINYTVSVRSTGSAINEKKIKNKEFKDPILYRENPLVSGYISDKKLLGNSHDMQNNAAIYSSIPEWITSVDEQYGDNNILNLTQIVSSYFDTLHLQIESLPRLRDVNYIEDGEKPLPFAKKLLESMGLVSPEIFIDSSVFEALLNRDEESLFEEKIYNVKNMIYHNIYNNIVSIYKSKGTEKSFRNILRCFGIGDNLIKINLYGNDVKYKLEDRYRSTSVKKNFLDFNDTDRFDSTVYQQKQPDNEHSSSYISGGIDNQLDYIPFTFEAAVIFPRKLQIDHPKYFSQSFGFSDESPSCIFGMHEAKEDNNDLSWTDSSKLGFRVVVIRDSEFGKNAKFRLDIRGMGVEPDLNNYGYKNGLLETQFFYDVYEDIKWNFAVRIRIDNNPDLTEYSTENVKYYLEFYGISTLLDSVENEFVLSYELTETAAKEALNANKRIFLGAEYKDFNGTRVSLSDVKIGEVRYWQDYLDNETIRYHSQDPDNYGVMDPYKPAFFDQTSINKRVPQIETLCLYWDFATVGKASPSDGIDGAENILSDSFFYVDDVSGGSIIESSEDARYSWLSKIVKTQHTGKGDFYYPEELAIDKNYLFAAKQNQPEIISSSDTIKILNQDDELFTKNIRPINYFWAIEKSMYQNISEEIMQVFAGISSFNNLLGEPVNRYRMEYKNLNKLRQIFFQRYIESPRVERYIRFYKWIDSSITEMIKQLIPASANFSEDMRTMIESHILERNKYWNKFPTLEVNQRPPEGTILGINESTYNWKYGSATSQQDENCLWWKKRAERDSSELTSGTVEVDDSKQKILESITTTNFGNHTKRNLSYEVAGDRRTYEGQTFAIRSLSSPYKFNVDFQNNIHSGINSRVSKKIDYVRAELADNNSVSFVEASNIANSNCKDNQEVKFPFLHSRLNIASEQTGLNGSMLSLFELNKELDTESKYWNSNHSDTYGDDKVIPLQGVFTETHVGGLQSRHITFDQQSERPEAWKFENGTYSPVDDDKPKAKYYRDEKTKRPVNIRNIKQNYGNYKFDYQVVQTSGRTNNNRWLIGKEGNNIQEGATSSSESILGLFDFKLPSRERSEHIFVQRFSAPGSPDTLSRGMLDVEAEEFSVYNGLNYRNLDVRLILKDLLTYHTKKWGYASYRRGVALLDCTTEENLRCRPNFHKDHRNTAYRPEIIDEENECKASRDNAYVTHQLPRSDYQYSWINSSTQKTYVEQVGNDLIIRNICPWGYVSRYPNIASYYPTIELDPTLPTYSKLVIKKDGEQIIIDDGIPFLNNYYKFEGENHPSTYDLVQENYNSCYEHFVGKNVTGLPIDDDNTFKLLENNNLTLNDMLLHRDGPYQVPTWKQIRNNEKKIVSRMRRENIISNLDVPKVISYRDDNDSLTLFRERRSQTVTNYVEPVVSWNSPIRTGVSFDPEMPRNFRFNNIATTYSNNIENFANPYLEKNLGLKTIKRQMYDFISERYKEVYPDDTAGIFRLRMFETSYKENIFPKHRNAGLNKTRSRRFYQEKEGYEGYDARASEIRTFWASDDKRERTSWNNDLDNHTGLNSLGYQVRRSSVWALEYKPRNKENIDMRGDLTWAGDPQYNGYTYNFITNESNDINVFDAEDSNSWIAPRARLQFIYNSRSLKAPEKAWLWKAAEISQNSPWHDDYDQYSKDIRLIGQNYSITPEFNISTHLDFYINKNSSDFYVDNRNILEMKGAFERDDFSGSLSRVNISRATSSSSTYRSQKNYASGWSELFNGEYETLLANDIRYISNVNDMFINEQPLPIDSELANNWKSKEPYPVVKLESENKISLSLDLTELVTELSDNTILNGLKIGTANTFNWNWSSPPKESDLLIDRWNNSFMLSSWVLLQDTQNNKNGIFEFTSDSFAQIENNNYISLNGEIIDLQKEKLDLSNLQNQLDNKVNDLNKVNNTLISNDTIAQIFEQRRTSISREIEQLTSSIDKTIKNIRNVVNSSRFLSEQTSKSKLISYFYLQEGNSNYGDLIWEDTYGNKLIFAIKASEIKNKWKNICLYYVGGGKSNKPSENRHRVILFIDGKWIPSQASNTIRMREIAGLAEDSLDVFINDGTLLFKDNLPKTISHISFAKAGDSYFSGKATDLFLYRGNPGLSELSLSNARNKKHNTPEDYRWFFDHKSNAYYSKTKRLFNNLANKIFKSQCEDANEIYSEWRDEMKVCKLVQLNYDIFFDFNRVPITILNEDDTEPTEQYINFESIVGIADIGKYLNSTLRSGIELPTNTFIPNLNDYLLLPPLSLGYGPFNVLNEGETVISEAGGEQVIQLAKNTACSELVGWWRLGVTENSETNICNTFLWKEEFFKCYSHTDTIHYLPKIMDDHRDFGIHVLRLEVDAIKKLLPYNGFYPSQRAMQLGSLFYDSIIPYVTGEDDNQAYARARTEQAALQPFFAPGILFNTIKSGIAVDWAAYSGRTGNELKDKIYDFVENMVKNVTPIEEFVSGFENTLAQNILNKIVTDDVYRQVSLNAVTSSRQVEELSRELMVSRANEFAEELRTYGTQIADMSGNYSRFNESTFISSLLRNESLARLSVQSLSQTVNNILQYIENTFTDSRISSSYNFSFEENLVNRIFDSEGAIINQLPTFRLPFESLVSLRDYLPNRIEQEDSKVFLLAPSYYQENYKNNSRSIKENEVYPYFEWTGQQNPLYEMAMHNFLAEIPNFFLKNNSLTNFKSAPQNQWKHVEEGWTYYLDVHLYKTNNFEMIMSPHNGKDIVIGVDNNGLPITTHGRYFGPSMRYLPEDAERDLNHLSVADPSQAAYVPPYFYGRAKARLKFKAPRTGQPTIGELLLNLEIDYINEEMEELFSSRTSGQSLTASQLYLAAIGEVPYKWQDTPAYQSRMPIQSSINFNGIAQEGEDSVWTISPKFESPVLNFKTEQNLSYLNKDNQCGTGMWGGYGEIPTSEQGIFLAIEESPVCSSEQPIDYSVLIGIPRDTREANRNIITLKDPTGRIDYIKIGQPSNAVESVGGRVNFYSWQDKYMNSSIAEILSADNSSEFIPYSADACIRTIGTSPRATLENLSVGMSGEYDIEAYLQADRYATNIDDLVLPATSNVPTSSDLANAIVYHIKLSRLRDRSFPWDARIVWVSSFDGERIRGISRERLSEEQDNGEFFRLSTSAKVVVEIIYDHDRSFLNNRRGRRELERLIATINPKITLESKTDPVMNPTGKLGIYYIDSQKNIDLLSDDKEVEIQRDREFYSRRILNACDDKIGSLMDVCGFTSQRSRIGEIADSKEISEALILIPFTDKPTGTRDRRRAKTIKIMDRYFFSISSTLWDSSMRRPIDSELPDNTVTDMIKKMKKYNLPPQFNFLNRNAVLNNKVKPFVMYIFEFTHNLDKDDLSNIWQGLMPKISIGSSLETQAIEHELSKDNFFEGRQLPNDMRWLVFRVKKKANTNYWDMANVINSNNQINDFTYNWPYDYCSLIELCKIQGGVVIKNTNSSIINEVNLLESGGD